MQKPVVEVDTTIAAPADKVWQAMQAGAMFPGTEIETDWKVGHPITFTGKWEGKSLPTAAKSRPCASPKN